MGEPLATSLSDFVCSASCKHRGKPWPPHLPKPGCRIVAEYMATDNPVTLATRREILRNRLGMPTERTGCAQQPDAAGGG